MIIVDFGDIQDGTGAFIRGNKRLTVNALQRICRIICQSLREETSM